MPPLFNHLATQKESEMNAQLDNLKRIAAIIRLAREEFDAALDAMEAREQHSIDPRGIVPDVPDHVREVLDN